MSPDGGDTAGGGRWSDLRARVASGVTLAVCCVSAIIMGDVLFHLFVAAVMGLMVWELTRMTAPEMPGRGALGGLAATVLIVATPWIDERWIAPAFAGLAAAAAMSRKSLVYGVFFFAMLIAAHQLVSLRGDGGMALLFWLAGVVAATDVFGYFGGRIIGGPKFWPSVSPKKTWAGVLCGWAAAALVGLGFAVFSSAGADLVWFSALLGFASQLGDIAQSALKRRAGVKDSSNLLPGHGGLFDRFDGLVGAALFMWTLMLFTDAPTFPF